MARLSDRIKELREDFGLSRLDLAKKLGVNKSTITRYENGDILPTIDTLIKIRETFGVTIDWITGVDTNGEDKYIPAVKRCIEEGITPEELLAVVETITKIKKR